MARKPKYHRQLVLQLSYAQLALIVNGARITQVDNEQTLNARQRYTLEKEGGLLLNSGAKLYVLGGHWYRISGYGYRVINKMPDRFKLDLRVDEQEVLNTLGYAA